MQIFKCKMCGGDLELTKNMTVAVCPYCGTKQTLPKLSDEKRYNLYDRAGQYRRNNEYDKAAELYEEILKEDPKDAESYWSLVLCKYGIEYVEDPSSHKRVPTINRTQYTSIFLDSDYASALKYADKSQRAIYEFEAKQIDEIQNNIIMISKNEEPFDIFICYKDLSADGRRSEDSVIAAELYHELTEAGYKVFFSRITLDDKMRIESEPYIFAALNSAKIMIVLSTRAEYFNSPWVKNEWSRYLALIRQGADKMLIPVYRDMNPYDLPVEFSHLQAMDMSKLGFMQDLVYGIQKILQRNSSNEMKIKSVIHSQPTAESLIKRAFLFLEDEEWERADIYCEKVLDMDPECAEAYLGKLMISQFVRREEELSKLKYTLKENPYYEKTIRFANSDLRSRLEEYERVIEARREFEAKEIEYCTASELLNRAKHKIDYLEVIKKLEPIMDFRDSAKKIKYCQEKVDDLEQQFRERERIEEEKKQKNSKYYVALGVFLFVIFVVSIFYTEG